MIRRSIIFIIFLTSFLFSQDKNISSSDTTYHKILYWNYLGGSLVGTAFCYYPLKLITKPVFDIMLDDENDNRLFFHSNDHLRFGTPILLGSTIGVTLQSHNKTRVFFYTLAINAFVFSTIYELSDKLGIFPLFYDLSIPLITATIAFQIDSAKHTQKINQKRLSLLVFRNKKSKIMLIGLKLGF